MTSITEPFRDGTIAKALSRRIHDLFNELKLDKLIIMHVCGTRV